MNSNRQPNLLPCILLCASFFWLSCKGAVAGFFVGGVGEFRGESSTGGAFVGAIDQTIGPVRIVASGGAFVSSAIAGPYIDGPTGVFYGSQPSALGSAQLSVATTLHQVGFALEEGDLNVTPINGIRFPFVYTIAFGTFAGSLAPGDSAFFRSGWQVTETSTVGASRGIVQDSSGNPVQGTTGLITITNNGSTDLPFSRGFSYVSSKYGPGQNDLISFGAPATYYTSSMSNLYGITKASSMGESWIGLSNFSMTTTAVPEPLSIALIAPVFLGIIVLKRRKSIRDRDPMTFKG